MWMGNASNSWERACGTVVQLLSQHPLTGGSTCPFLAVGGNWPGSPDGSTVFPQDLVIDYVRVYQDGVTGLNQENAALKLEQNHPNPFTDYSTIGFSLPTEQHVFLEVYDGRFA